MVITSFVLGVIMAFFGVLFLFFPRFLHSWNVWMNKVLFTDKNTLRYRLVLGLLLLALGAWLLFIVWRAGNLGL